MTKTRYGLLNGPFVDTIIETEMEDSDYAMKMIFPKDIYIKETNETGRLSIGDEFNTIGEK